MEGAPRFGGLHHNSEERKIPGSKTIEESQCESTNHKPKDVGR